MAKRKSEPTYLESIIDWQQHQFVKGYYIGGKRPFTPPDMPFWKRLRSFPASIAKITVLTLWIAACGVVFFSLKNQIEDIFLFLALILIVGVSVPLVMGMWIKVNKKRGKRRKKTAK